MNKRKCLRVENVCGVTRAYNLTGTVVSMRDKVLFTVNPAQLITITSSQLIVLRSGLCSFCNKFTTY